MWDEYVWIVVVGAFVAFFMAFGIGANDVANAFATSIGSKTLTLFQATILAAIAEFSGALLLGRGVASTVKSGIVDADFFEGEPEIIMVGMLVALTAAGTWLIVATYLEMPVSTTHSIIGGLVGWGLVAKGGDAILWFELDRDEDFPVKGIAAVVISWVFSPVASGIVALFFFWSVRGLVLRHDNSFDRAFYFLPVLVGITFFINAFYVLDKGINKQLEQTTETSAWVAAIVGAVAAIAAVAAAVWLKGYATKTLAAQDEKSAQKASDIEKGIKPEEEEKSTSFFARLQDAINSNDPHSVVETHEATKAIHDNAEKFDPNTEYVFRYLQVLTAFADSFAHGGNDVANAIGPFSAIYSIYRDGHFSSKTETQVWVLVLGGAGIVLGLSTYGYHIIKAIGVKLAKITPSRGFAIELGSALIVVTGSYLGLPLSTTHCQVGATVFVGLLEGGKGVSWVVIGKSIAGWVFTLIVVGFLSAILMSLAIFTPNLRASEALANIRGTVLDQAPAVAEAVRSSCPAATPSLTAELDMLVASAESSANNTFVSRFPNRLADTVALLGDVSTTNFGGATVACSATPEVSEEAEVEE